MKALAYALFAAFVGATLSSCEVLVNEDGSKSVIVDAAQLSKVISAKAGLEGDNVKYENGKIIATK